MQRIQQIYRYLFDASQGSRSHFLARWLFLRSLGFIYFSAFFALLFQVLGLIGSHGILSAAEYLKALGHLGPVRFWYVPTLLWINATDHAITALYWIGLFASILLIANLWPRAMLWICFLCFLSFVTAAQDFSSYQSDGMLLEAGFLSLFLAPPGLLPGLGRSHPPTRAVLFLLLWEWFRIYFESGLVKLLSGDPTWRNLTAMYEYYQNGPLPTWIGWYVQHLPHWFHIASAALTLIMELFLVWMAFLPRPWKIACFFLVTAWQTVVILTANYAFLNYLVLVLAFLLLDDTFLTRFVPHRWRAKLVPERQPEPLPEHAEITPTPTATHTQIKKLASIPTAIMLVWIFYAGTFPLFRMLWSDIPLLQAPVTLLEPFRIANQYGLFAVMTPHRYEIEFQGSNDLDHWTSYPFRYKPQAVDERPRIYAPYQPRFDWNLWFASLGSWQQNLLVPRTEEHLLTNDADVLYLFASNPFAAEPPKYVRAVLFQYWFSTSEQLRTQHLWWRRELLGTYAPTLTRLPNGDFNIVEGASLEGQPQP